MGRTWRRAPSTPSRLVRAIRTAACMHARAWVLATGHSRAGVAGPALPQGFLHGMHACYAWRRAATQGGHIGTAPPPCPPPARTRPRTHACAHDGTCFIALDHVPAGLAPAGAASVAARPQYAVHDPVKMRFPNSSRTAAHDPFAWITAEMLGVGVCVAEAATRQLPMKCLSARH